jgi:predicted nucleic acid-binding protein
MRRLFADTFYWGALFHQRDSWHARVVAFSRTLTPYDRLWTTDAILTEVLAMFSGAGAYLRQGAARRVRATVSDARVTLIPCPRDLFLAGLALYEQRPDKSYSLTDCISMHVMRQEGLTDVLTNDHHFEQEGFRILFPDTGARVR